MNRRTVKLSPLAIILIVSVLLRVIASFLFGNTVEILPAVADQFSYHTLATRFVEGHGFTFGTDWWPATRANEPTAHWSYLYTLYLSFVYLIFGQNPLVARLIQALISGILIPWLVFRVTRQVFRPYRQWRSFTNPPPPEQTDSAWQKNPERQPRFSRIEAVRGLDWLTNIWRSPAEIIPLLAAAWVAFYGYFVYFAAALMTETFYITGILWVLDCALRIANPTPYNRQAPISRHHKNATPPVNGALEAAPFTDTPLHTLPKPQGYLIWLELGAAIAITALLRQVFLPFVPVLFIWIGWARLRWERRNIMPNTTGLEGERHLHSTTKGFKTILTGSLLAVLTAILIITPVTAYNYLRFNTFVLLNTNAGYAFYWSNHPVYGTQYISILTPEMPDYYALLPKDVLWMNEAQLDRELMRQGIGFVIADISRYLILSIDRIPAYFIFWPLPTSSLFSNINRVISYGLAFPFIIAGVILWISDVRRKRISLEPGLLLLLFSLVYSLIHLLSWAGIRYRLPVDALTLIFAARGLYSLGKLALFRK